MGGVGGHLVAFHDEATRAMDGREQQILLILSSVKLLTVSLVISPRTNLKKRRSDRE